ISAEKKAKDIFTNITYKDNEGGNEISDLDGIDSLSIHIDWSIAEKEIKAGDSASYELSKDFIIEQKQGQLQFKNQSIASYEISDDNVLVAAFEDEVDAHADAEGTLVIEAKQEVEADE